MKIISPKLYLLLLSFPFLILTQCQQINNPPREKTSFNTNWRFHLGDSSIYSSSDYIDKGWRTLNIPHDWSIEGSFSEQNPAGISGGSLPGGIGWYRKKFTIDESQKGKLFYILFDGVYQNSEVYINGHLLGKRPNGYISFQYELNPYLNYGEKTNTIAVKVDNSDQPNSRWYSGSGIYRNVYLIKTNKVHVSLWGSYISCTNVSEKSADINIETTVDNTSGIDQDLTISTEIFNMRGKTVGKTKTSSSTGKKYKSKISQHIKVENPDLWDLETPNMYKALLSIWNNDTLIDEYETSFGIRSFEFNSEKGFILNGKPVKIKGVCMHHDLGALGAAVNLRALERQLEILKEMGCNGIRTSHNPPAPELLDLCDKMGFIVQNETFDVWARAKVKNDYSLYWDKWHEKDLRDHLLRDRNHPSIFSWSIGNEILEQWYPEGIEMTKELVSIVKEYTPDIPVTAGFNNPEPNNYMIRSEALDIIGFNYSHDSFALFPQKYPNEIFIATETTSSLNSRGFYDMPSDSLRIWPVRWDIPFNEGNPNNTCSSYDNCKTPWGSTHEDSWKIIKKHDFLSGMYIWTGFDYLGEPTPYQWPSRSSYFGIIDLAGFPKDAYYMYQSEWANKEVLHVFPHWNWKDGQEIDIWAYSNFDEVELFINDKSQGIKTKEDDDLHFQWKVNFEAGELKAIGKNKNGSSKELTINTAGKPYRIKLEADRNAINADGLDLSFITVSVLDKNNSLVPNADHLIHFEVPNGLSIAGVDNGNQISHESFKDSKRKAFQGKCLLIIQSKCDTGEFLIQAKSDSLLCGELQLKVN